MAAKYHWNSIYSTVFPGIEFFCIALANLKYERVNIRKLLKWSTGDKPSNAELINFFFSDVIFFSTS